MQKFGADLARVEIDQIRQAFDHHHQAHARSLGRDLAQLVRRELRHRSLRLLSRVMVYGAIGLTVGMMVGLDGMALVGVILLAIGGAIVVVL